MTKDKIIGMRASADFEGRIHKRAAQVGAKSVSDYIRALVEADLTEAFTSPSSSRADALGAIASTLATPYDADQIKQWCEKNGIKDQREIVQLIMRGLWKSTDTITAENLEEPWTVAPRSKLEKPAAEAGPPSLTEELPTFKGEPAPYEGWTRPGETIADFCERFRAQYKGKHKELAKMLNIEESAAKRMLERQDFLPREAFLNAEQWARYNNKTDDPDYGDRRYKLYRKSMREHEAQLKQDAKKESART
ncbi:MAG: hypothetical protein AAFX93_20020 [Verrucomicrobiota bacterium]